MSQWDQKLGQLLQQAMSPQETQLGMLAKWGTPQDNAIRNFGSTIRSPAVPLDSKLNFEQRILKPSSYPVINNDDGSESTHKMAYGEADGKYVAFPTIVQSKATGKLHELSPGDAFRYAMQSGEFRDFDKEEDAAAYADGGYKKFWGLGEKK